VDGVLIVSSVTTAVAASDPSPLSAFMTPTVTFAPETDPVSGKAVIAPLPFAIAPMIPFTSEESVQPIVQA